MANDTFDHKRTTRHYGLLDVDTAFKRWWQEKLSITLTTKDGHQKKVPVFFFSSERWSKAREDGGLRDDGGSLILPMIAITRPPPSTSNDGPFGRTFAENKEEYTYSKQLHPKSSEIKNLVKNRPTSVDPDAPIFEIFTVPVPDHYQLSYEIKIWAQYVEEMNEIIEKIGQELDFKSERSFQFATEDGYYFIAFQEDDFVDDSNLDDYSQNERIVRMNATFVVPAHILPKSNQRQDSFRRYLSQTKLTIKTEVVMDCEEFEERFGET